MKVNGITLTQKDIEREDSRLYCILNNAFNKISKLLEIKQNKIDTSSSIKPSIKEITDMVDASRSIHDYLRREMFYFTSNKFEGKVKIRPLDWMYENYLSKEEFEIHIKPIIRDIAIFTQFLTCIDNLEQRNKIMIGLIFENLSSQMVWVGTIRNKVGETMNKYLKKEKEDEDKVLVKKD